MKSRRNKVSVGSPRMAPRAGTFAVPFDSYSLSNKFEWIMNESETNFELYIKPVFSVDGACRDLSAVPTISLHINRGRRQR